MKALTTYLNFDGNCREAMKFYENCLGMELQVTTYAQMPGSVADEAKDRVMHAMLTRGAFALMASDTLPGRPYEQGNNFAIAIECESLPEIEKSFQALSEQGQVTMPLQDAPWGARFGMLTDQFGVRWMLNFEHPKN